PLTGRVTSARLLITLSARPATATPNGTPKQPSRFAARRGHLSPRDRSGPAPPPGLPAPEGLARRGRAAARRPPPGRAGPGGALRLFGHHDPASPGRARPRAAH